MARVDPIAALRRTAFLLERSGASTYRVQAFRTAALALAGLPPDELDRRIAGRSLTDIDGVGPRTAGVVAEAVAGRVPDYLADLEAAAGPLAEGGEEVLAALRGDLHSHTDASDGGSPLAEMAVTAIELGREYQAVTDHSPRLKIANGLSAHRLRGQLALVATVRPRLEPFRLLTGIEVDILDDGQLDQEPDLLDELDVVVASVHSKLRMERPAMTRRMLAAVRNPRVDVLGHCTGRQVTGKHRPESEFDAAAVFAACAENGVAVEINCRPDRLDPPRRLLRQAVEAGCLFSIDTDAHAPGQLDWLARGAARAAECEVPIERIVTTWPVDDLLAWTRDRTLPTG
jgi:putative hydrolase